MTVAEEQARRARAINEAQEKKRLMRKKRKRNAKIAKAKAKKQAKQDGQRKRSAAEKRAIGEWYAKKRHEEQEQQLDRLAMVELAKFL